MKDPGLVCFGLFVVITYGIYMIFGPGGDGIIFGTVVGALCVLAGVKYEKMKQTRYIRTDFDVSEVDEHA